MNGIKGIQDNPGALAEAWQDVEYIDDTAVEHDKSADMRLASAAPAIKPPVNKGGSFKPPVDKGGSKKPPVNKGGAIKPPVDKGGIKPPVDKGGVNPPVTKVGSGKSPANQPKRPPVKRSASGQPLKTLSRDSAPEVPTPVSTFERVTTTVNTVVGVLSLIPQLHSVFNANGEAVLPNGTVLDAQGETATYPDGTVQHVDGRIVHTDGTIEHADGSFEYKDGTWKMADGAVQYPNGNWLLADGTLIDAEGNELGKVAPA
ncbi:hypothetical protein [Pseudomonas ovata]|uniref:hypothetical protein n=1 Tax=Pseudomonas ovata TaxID=1839709 RepID=UPI000D69DA47|nr:hypothetical protein [Pseudomonas ovata]